MDIVSYILSKKYTDDTVIGGGAIKGKNCIISNITEITGGHRITFQWTLDDGTVENDYMNVMDGADGADGKGIYSVSVNEEEHLIITYTDGTTSDAGKIEVTSSVDSVNGKTGDVILNANDVGALPSNTPLFSGSYDDLTNKPSIPSTTSDLVNDSNFVADADYVHTDNNYDATSKEIVDGITNALSNKVDKVIGKGLSTNDYTTAEKTKLAGIEAGAEVNPTSGVKTATESFETVNGGLLQKCAVDLEPVQDLHGYDSPWAGGSGKNLVYIENGTIINDATKDNSTPRRCRTGNMSYLDANTDYVISASTSISGRTVLIAYQTWTSDDFGGNTKTFDSGWHNNPKVINLTSGAWFTFVLKYSDDSLINYDELTVQLEKGSSPTDFEPYENICPISGHTEVDLYNVGKNWFNKDNYKFVKNSYIDGNNAWVGNTTILTYPDDALSNYWNSVLIDLTPYSGKTITYSRFVSANGTYRGLLDKDFNVLAILGNSSVASQTVDLSQYPTAKYLALAFIKSSYNFDSAQLELGSTATSYEPYLGHLYQVQIGSTVYGGYVDLVSGVITVTHEYIEYDGSEDEEIPTVEASLCRMFIVCPDDSITNTDLQKLCGLISNRFKEVINSQTYTGTIGFHLRGNGTHQIVFSLGHDSGLNTPAKWRTWLSNNPIQVVYPLANPFTVTLTPQQIEALVGQNNLSTPLSGQSIDSIEYREVFAFDDVEKVVSLRVPISMLGTDESGRTTASQSYASGDYFYKDGYMCKALTSISAGATLTLNTNYEYSTLDEILESKVDKSDIYANAGSHNSIYRGKYLGSSVTAEQWAAIQNGTFKDLFIGDYWTINSVNWRIAHFDYWLGTGDTECTDHHVVIVPDTDLYSAQMNTENVTTGGYYNSEMRGGANYLISGSSNLYTAKTKVDSAFGSAHILTHKELLTNDVTSGNASGWDWYDSTVDLMSEVMVYGTLAWSNGGKGYEVGCGKGQLALFRHDISKATNRARWWLRGVYSAANFALVNSYGNASYNSAYISIGVRPAFAIK